MSKPCPCIAFWIPQTSCPSALWTVVLELKLALRFCQNVFWHGLAPKWFHGQVLFIYASPCAVLIYDSTSCLSSARSIRPAICWRVSLSFCAPPLTRCRKGRSALYFVAGPLMSKLFGHFPSFHNCQCHFLHYGLFTFKSFVVLRLWASIWWHVLKWPFISVSQK